MALDHYYAVILAGGGGTRLWPMSRKDKPKQLLPLIEERTMFQISIDRLKPVFPPDNIYIVTGPDYAEEMKRVTPYVRPENFIVEPYGRDNAPATALAVSVIHERDPEATIALLAADHHIADMITFLHLLRVAHDVACDNYIVTLGIQPQLPATSFGYIQQGEVLKEVEGHTCYESLGFTEKPDIVTANNFVASGKYSWNSGMFVWTAKRALAEFRAQQPEMSALLEELRPTIDTPDYDATLRKIWDDMPKTSIDFAIMEGADRLVVIPADIGWSDVGSWGSLFDVLDLDRFGNCFRGRNGERVILDTENTMVYSDRMIVTIGVEDMIVVDTDDVLMVCHKDRSQEVKDVVNHLKATKKEQYL